MNLLSGTPEEAEVVLDLYDKLKSSDNIEEKNHIAGQILKMSEEVTYTHWYDKKPRLVYKLYTWIRIPEEECERNHNLSCQKGLHCGNPEWVDNQFGKYNTIVEVNPKDVRAILTDSNVCRMVAFKPMGFVKDWSKIDDFEFDYFSFDILTDNHQEAETQREEKIVRDEDEVYDEKEYFSEKLEPNYHFVEDDKLEKLYEEMSNNNRELKQLNVTLADMVKQLKKKL
jgi:hypothetical protein